PILCYAPSPSAMPIRADPLPYTRSEPHQTEVLPNAGGSSVDHPDLSVLLVRVLWLTLIGVTVVAASYAMSWLAPRLIALRDSIRALVAHCRSALREQLPRLRARLETFWQALAREPHLPMALQLRRLTEAVDQVGQGAVVRLEQVERSVQVDI